MQSAFWIVESLWAIIKVVLPFESSSKDFWILISVVVSKAEVASSKIKIGGFFKKHLAIETLCFWPPESFIPRSPTTVSYPCGIFIISSWISARFAAVIISSSVQLIFP